MIPIVIPSYEPDERFPAILTDLNNAGLGPVVVVDDGSGDNYQNFFAQAEQIIKPLGGVVLHHDGNKGKGRALKTAFSYILDNMPEATGCVTADSDGQHSVECIKKCMDALIENQRMVRRKQSLRRSQGRIFPERMFRSSHVRATTLQ